LASRNRAPKTSPALPGRRLREEPRSWPVPVPSRAELAAAFAQALDLAEGRRPGHAARVCYIALNLAQTIGLPPEEQRTAFYASLLHDAGAASASAEVCRHLNLSEEAIFGAQPGMSPQHLALEIAPSDAALVVEALRAHQEHGAEVARQLGFETAIQAAITTHHERWDGHGYPQALRGQEIPIAGRLVAAADLIESLISDGPNPLTARRNVFGALAEHAGSVLDAALSQRAGELLKSDGFWLGLHSHALSLELADSCPEGPSEDERSPADLWAFAKVFATLADAKGEHTDRHSERTAAIAVHLAEALGFRNGRKEMLHIAAVLHNVGLLGVPARVIAKPDILSLSEMEEMRKHPTYSQLVLEALPRMEDMARWVGAHHERPDGKGYPEMLDEETIPLESRIIALADTYVALTSARPYRRALSHEDAQQVLLGGAGTQLDRKLVRLLCVRSRELRSSRTAPRSQRRR
jgi:HD-GYP domain-containing protein (c-di-GMP phosphodiesterase class II)